MGVKDPDDSSGDHPLELVCRNADCDQSQFWTDEMMGNDCPECGQISYKPANTTTQ